MKRVDFIISFCFGIIVYLSIAIPAYFDLLAHQPAQVNLNQAYSAPASTAWIVAAPYGILIFSLTFVFLLLIRKFIKLPK